MRTYDILQAWLFAFVSVTGLGQPQSRLAFEVASGEAGRSDEFSAAAWSGWSGAW
jgi:hypothetical protein